MPFIATVHFRNRAIPQTGAHPEKYGRVQYKLLSETGASLDDIFLGKIIFLV